MSVLRSLVMAFACFSCLPMPQVRWEPDSMRYMMCCFPAVGVVIGALVYVWVWLCAAMGFGPVLRAAGIALVPVAVSGGIHLDGFADVLDARASHASPERKREILKDPHVGAFAVIGCVAYMIAYVSVATELVLPQMAVPLACIPVLSRALSGVATVAFEASSEQGMLAMEQGSAYRERVLVALVAWLAATAAVMCLAGGLAMLALVVVGLVALVLLRPFAMRQFGGMSGDVAGFFLQATELAMLVCLVLAAKAVGL